MTDLEISIRAVCKFMLMTSPEPPTESALAAITFTFQNEFKAADYSAEGAMELVVSTFNDLTMELIGEPIFTRKLQS